MTTYLTWLPDELNGKANVNGVPTETQAFHPINASRPAEAAARAAMRAQVTKHPYYAVVCVMRADHLGQASFRVNRYEVRFERRIKSVEARGS